MRKKGSNFFEEHIEKQVLAVVGLVCMWLLITRVVISPNKVEYEQKKFSVNLHFQYALDKPGLRTLWGRADAFILPELQQEFAKNGILLSQPSKVSIVKKGSIWRITPIFDSQNTMITYGPKTSKTYMLRKESGRINIYACEGALGPGEIDIRISREAELLKSKMDSKPKPPPPYKRRVDDFIGLVNLPIGDIDISLYWPLPIHSSADISDKRKYRIPWIGEVNGAAIECIRAVAYVPTIDIDEENPYDLAVCEPNDIDFVTVEAKFDVAGLYGRFYDNFAGDGVEQEEWRDPCLANPVFAAVQLQRQELGADGSWSEWQIVPRTKIDPRKKMFESVEEVEELPPGGIKVRLLQFDDAEVRITLLQPEAYKIASAKEEWFPPLLHKRYVERLEEIELEKKRRAKEAERKEREEEREKARDEREKAREERRSKAFETGSYGGQYGGRRDGFTRGEERFGPGRAGREPRTRRDRSERWSETESSSRRQEREERARERELRLAKLRAASRTTSLDDIYKELDEILITRVTDIAKLREALVVWAHDDTVEPEKSYRYRIRLGVFNPIAGTNQFNEQDEDLKNKIVLWSEFSEATETVRISGTLYFFPRDVQEAARIVTVQVTRYALGYWYSKDFAVKPGEIIGKVAEFKPVEKKKGTIVPTVLMAPQTIDYATGAVLVDVVSVNDWSDGRNMYARHYYDMLYSFDGGSIEHMPINPKYWDEELRIKLNEIKGFQKEPKEPLRGWDTQPAGWELAPELEYRYDEPVDVREEPRRPRRRVR